MLLPPAAAVATTLLPLAAVAAAAPPRAQLLLAAAVVPPLLLAAAAVVSPPPAQTPLAAAATSPPVRPPLTATAASPPVRPSLAATAVAPSAKTILRTFRPLFHLCPNPLRPLLRFPRSYSSHLLLLRCLQSIRSSPPVPPAPVFLRLDSNVAAFRLAHLSSPALSRPAFARAQNFGFLRSSPQLHRGQIRFASPCADTSRLLLLLLAHFHDFPGPSFGPTTRLGGSNRFHLFRSPVSEDLAHLRRPRRSL